MKLAAFLARFRRRKDSPGWRRNAEWVAPERLLNRRPVAPGEAACGRARIRLLILVAGFALAWSVVAGRLALLTLLNDSPEPASLASASDTPLSASRADVTDRNGALLATSLPLFSLCANAPKLLDPEEAATKLLTVLPDLQPDQLRAALTSGKQCAMIRRRLTPRQYYAINRLGVAGLEIRPDEGRSYPAGRLTAHIVGYTDIDNRGIAGLEKALDERLERQPDPVALTLDLRLQTILHRELGAALREFRAIGAAGLVMDARNGEILALASLPDFDPLKPSAAAPEERFNRATLGVYEMGSTFKIFSAAQALDAGLVRPSETFDVTRPLTVGKQVIRDFHPSGRPLSVAEIFMESSNIGAALMAERIGPVRQRAFLSRLGLLDRSPLELPETGTPLVPPPEKWSDATTMTVAFGHGVSVNAAQLAGAVASVMNGSPPIRPTLLLRAPGKAPSPDEPEAPVVSAATAARMRALMRLVVTHGTAHAADVAGYMVGGKTGTSEKAKNGRYDPDARLSSFVGVFPAHAPRYVILVLLDEPKGNAKTYGFATGGWTAAPVVGRIVGQMGPLLDLPPLDPALFATAERQLLRPLGPEVLNALPSRPGTDDYASVSPYSAH